MQKVIFVFVLLLLLQSATSCQVRKAPDPELEHFDSISRSANEALLKRDFAEAERQFSDAAAYAEKIKWVDGVVMSKRNISGIKIAQKDLSGAEEVLLDAKQICLQDQKCSGGQLDSIFGHLVKFYAFRKKDPSKISGLVDEVIGSRSRLADSKPIEAILESISEDLSVAGFKAQAEEVRSRLNELSD
ncbi:MAG TPA: hypothetical protein VJV05_00670 [Pyrinomonadaceae bacterium]|nr:hypothetical protein [Pyrinomonadaceae bacterium]